MKKLFALLLALMMVFTLTACGNNETSVIGIVNALGGKAKELPVIGKYKILK